MSTWMSKYNDTFFPRVRYNTIAVILFVLPLFFFACGTETKQFEHYGGWNIVPFNYTFQVFVVHGNVPEADLRSSADSLSRQYLESYETVELVFTRDLGLAEKLAGSEARKYMLQGTSSFDPGKLMLHGGAWYRRDQNSDNPEWLFYPQPVTTNP